MDRKQKSKEKAQGTPGIFKINISRGYPWIFKVGKISSMFTIEITRLAFDKTRNLSTMAVNVTNKTREPICRVAAVVTGFPSETFIDRSRTEGDPYLSIYTEAECEKCGSLDFAEQREDGPPVEDAAYHYGLIHPNKSRNKIWKIESIDIPVLTVELMVLPVIKKIITRPPKECDDPPGRILEFTRRPGGTKEPRLTPSGGPCKIKSEEVTLEYKKATGQCPCEVTLHVKPGRKAKEIKVKSNCNTRVRVNRGRFIPGPPGWGTWTP